MSDIGHNSAVAPDLLKSFVERIERIHTERKDLADDVSEIYGEAKSQGFDVKILRKVINIRQQDAAKRREEQEILDLYLSALGMPA